MHRFRSRVDWSDSAQGTGSQLARNHPLLDTPWLERHSCWSSPSMRSSGRPTPPTFDSAERATLAVARDDVDEAWIADWLRRAATTSTTQFATLRVEGVRGGRIDGAGQVGGGRDGKAAGPGSAPLGSVSRRADGLGGRIRRRGTKRDPERVTPAVVSRLDARKSAGTRHALTCHRVRVPFGTPRLSGRRRTPTRTTRDYRLPTADPRP
jgi:hypothetical protein